MKALQAPTPAEKSLARAQFEFLLEHASKTDTLIALVNAAQCHYEAEMRHRGLPEETNPSEFTPRFKRRFKR
jgi:hypothetical protein